ncbi:hypothetical protein CNMCM6069_009042 [Aspergillus lentulus]|nr:hypothetical protein CNMCM6069_009042 [Aspergillus lentulus]KAF4174817.1 hypothetical protein CNMCM8060_008033 [Aspergillus lentulus]
MDTTNYPKKTLHSLCGRTIVRISNDLVVKSGNLRSQEAQTLRFIATNTTTLSPKPTTSTGKLIKLCRLTIIGQIDSLEGGPFNSEEEFNEFILSDIVPSAPELLRHYARFALMDGHSFVFTHGDLAPRDILVDEGRVTALLDSEYAGWYPEYWEYVQALRQLRPMKNWPEYLARILPPRYEREYIGMSFLGRILRH